MLLLHINCYLCVLLLQVDVLIELVCDLNRTL